MAAASPNTRPHSSAVNSRPAPAWTGFEQYGQCSGQRYVTSATRPRGRGGVCAAVGAGAGGLEFGGPIMRIFGS